MAQWADTNMKRLQSSLQAMDLAGQTRQRGVQNVFTGLGMLNDTIQKFGMQGRDLQAQKERQESQQDFQKSLLGREEQQPTDFGKMAPQGGAYSAPARVEGLAPVTQTTQTVFKPGVGTLSQDYLDASKFGRDVTARGKEFESAMEMLGIPREKWDFMKENIFHFGPREGWGIPRKGDEPKYTDVAEYVRQEGSNLAFLRKIAGDPVPDPEDPNRMVFIFNKGDEAAKAQVKKLLKDSLATRSGTEAELLKIVPGKDQNERMTNLMKQVDLAVDTIWAEGKLEVAAGPTDTDAIYREKFTKFLDAQRKVMRPYLNKIFKDGKMYQSTIEKLKAMGYTNAGNDLNIANTLAFGDDPVGNLIRSYGNTISDFGFLENQWRLLKDLQKIMEGETESSGAIPWIDRYNKGAANQNPYGKK
jgi:hypothetical protein